MRNNNKTIKTLSSTPFFSQTQLHSFISDSSTSSSCWVVQLNGEWELWSVQNSSLLLPPHTSTLLQCGHIALQTTGLQCFANSSHFSISPVWGLSRILKSFLNCSSGVLPTGHNSSRTAPSQVLSRGTVFQKLQNAPAWGSSVPQFLSDACSVGSSFLQGISACCSAESSVGYRVDISSDIFLLMGCRGQPASPWSSP